MPFELTSDQEMIRGVVAEFAAKELSGKPAERIDRERRYPREVMTKLAELGLLGMLVPPEQGGPGTDAVAYAVAVEEIAKASGTTAAAVTVANALVAWPVAKYGSEAIRAKVLAPLLAGQALGAWALAEPASGSDLTAVQTRAEKSGDGYTLHGLKSFVTGAPGADWFIVFAKVAGGDGLTAFVVPKDAEGLKVGPAEKSLSFKGLDMAQVYLHGVQVPSDMRLGDEGQGLAIATAAGDLHRLGVAAVAVGLMQAALDEAIGYSGERVQFRQKIREFQAIQWKVADMDARIRASRLLVFAAAARRDAGADAAADIAAAKLFAGESAKLVTQEGLRIHGGAGFMRDIPPERLNRDARATSVFGGTSEMSRALLASRLLGL
ncbi:MAG TPA: acyl-CoA dehydrogenase family protein [Candidatus Thermoplasmatota archaeon]|nr:acyl-CoA dehydrogenase family protein [Candidatus Thermoplasmatota archaeon]